MRVGLLIVATGRYLPLALDCWKSAQNHFMRDHDVELVLFNDGTTVVQNRVRFLPWSRFGWPEDTLRRYYAFVQFQHILNEYDFLWHLDADMSIVAPVGNEIVSDRTAVLHPGFVGKRGSYEDRIKSAAYVRPGEGSHYYCGGSGGGRPQQFLQTSRQIVAMAERDRRKGFMAVWHDESYLNRDAIDRPPALVLDPGYCYPENWRLLGYKKRILALDKNHAEMRA